MPATIYRFPKMGESDKLLPVYSNTKMALNEGIQSA